MADDLNRLQFVGSDRLWCECTTVGGWEFQSAAGRYLGRFAGVLTDARSRTIRYFVVDGADAIGSKQYLVSFRPAQIDRDAHALRLQPGDVEFSDLEGLEVQGRRDLMDDQADGSRTR